MHIPLTRIQRLIGDRMLISKLSKPCFYIESKADVTEMMALRLKLTKSLGVRITSNSFLIRALSLVTKKYPLMLGNLNDNGSDIRIDETINVGFAVHSSQGLVVPVIKNADKKTLSEIASEEKVLIEKARNNSLILEQITGQTIGLSNLGAYGVDSFIGIIPPLVTTILAVGNVVARLIPKGEKPVTRKTMSLSLAVDNRVVDEVYAAQFLRLIIEGLQNPSQLC